MERGRPDETGESLPYRSTQEQPDRPARGDAGQRLRHQGRGWLLRRNSKLRGKAGEREESEEELQPAAFDADLERLAKASEQLERFRLKVIDWLYPGID